MKACRQSGASLVVTLVMLVIMSLGAIGLVRSIDTSLMVASNLAFRESAVLASDAGTEAAINWLSPLIMTADLAANQSDAGYYASVPDGLDISGMSSASAKVAIDWDGTKCKDSKAPVCQQPAVPLTTTDAGNSVRYIIHRLCRTVGSADSAANNCLMYQVGLAANLKKSQISYGAASIFSSTASVYYRITVRVRGPRNTTVFTQTLIHF
jgi:type IV pilus assembly protein PilX